MVFYGIFWDVMWRYAVAHNSYTYVLSSLLPSLPPLPPSLPPPSRVSSRSHTLLILFNPVDPAQANSSHLIFPLTHPPPSLPPLPPCLPPSFTTGTFSSPPLPLTSSCFPPPLFSCWSCTGSPGGRSKGEEGGREGGFSFVLPSMWCSCFPPPSFYACRVLAHLTGSQRVGREGGREEWDA